MLFYPCDEIYLNETAAAETAKYNDNNDNPDKPTATKSSTGEAHCYTSFA